MYRNLTIRQKQIVWAWAFLALPVLFYGVIRFYPTGNAILISFQDWNLLGDRTWAGLENYRTLAADPVFWQVFRTTFVYLLLGTPVSLVVSFVVAYHLDRTRFMHGFLRMLYFLPFMTSAVAMAWVWRWFYQPVPTGLFNNALASIGVGQVNFLNSTTNALPAILAPAVWAGLGFQIIIFMAGLRAIPRSYYEAARIAGIEMEEEAGRIEALMARFKGKVLAAHPGILVNGHETQRWPGNLNLSFPGLDGERLLAELRDLAVSSGAACASATTGPSYVLEALGQPRELAQSAIRFGIGRFTSEEEIDIAAERLIAAITALGGIRATDKVAQAS